MAETADQIRADVDRYLDALDELAELGDERYHLTHERFEAASNQRREILNWFSRFAASSSNDISGHSPEWLSVGCGGGVMDRRIADVIGRLIGPVSITGVDPNPRHLSAFSAAFEGSPHRASMFSGGFGEFQSDQGFDLIYFLHCLYYFDSIEPALNKACDHLRPGGALVVLQAPNGALNHLADRVWRRQFEQSAWYSDDVLSVLRSMEGQVSCERIDSQVDVTRCFDENDPTGVELLDFIVQAETRRFPAELRALLRDSLRAVCRPDGDRLLAPHPVDALLFRKD